MLVERTVYEVTAVEAGHGVSVRDLRTGDRLDVRDRALSGRASVGQRLCARIETREPPDLGAVPPSAPAPLDPAAVAEVQDQMERLVRRAGARPRRPASAGRR